MLAHPAHRRAGRSVPPGRCPEGRGFRGLLPCRMLHWRRPIWWQELSIIVLAYWLYSLSRNAIPEQASIAIRHGFGIARLQDALHLNAELSINHFVAGHEWLAQVMDYYYASLHLVITMGVMVWLFVKRAAVYRGARTVLVTTTLLGLAGFALYPLAPPRLLPGAGYLDTVVIFHTWGSLASPSVAAQSNQYAAMPSLHVGWALWCGIMLWRYGGTRLAKVLGVLYPLGTALVVMGTANHYLLDAVAGVAVMGVGLLLAPRLMRAADAVRARLFRRATAVADGTGSPIVSAGCQTSAGERIPRQRESQLDGGAEPDASPADAGEGAAAPAR
jgi:hypothetical protein